MAKLELTKTPEEWIVEVIASTKLERAALAEAVYNKAVSTINDGERYYEIKDEELAVMDDVHTMLLEHGFSTHRVRDNVFQIAVVRGRCVEINHSAV